MAPTRAPLDPLVIGADIGNATTSIARPDGTVAFFPSAFASFGVGPYQGLSKIETTRHHISYRDRHAVVGCEAFDMPGHDTLLTENAGHPERRYTDDESFLCLLAGISAAFPLADTVAVRLATGAPLSLYEAHGAAIAKHYQGTHEYRYNGHARRLIVERVAVYGEGREAWRLLTPDQLRGNVAIHDIGGRTWNVLFFKDGSLKAARTFDMGMERLLDSVAAIPRDPAARWTFQRELRANAKAHRVTVSQVEAAIAAALPVIERKMALSQAHRHALLGGGAGFAVAPLRQRYSAPAIILGGATPESANALAYALAASEVA
jgi:hypothetical protein